MIISANICKKHSGKRRARIAFWESEGKVLRKKHRSLLYGAALLTVIILLSHILFCAEIYGLLRLLSVNEYVCRIFACTSVIFGVMIFSLLNLGGRHLALSLYRKERTPDVKKITVGELFYSFGSRKRRIKSSHVLYADLKRFIFAFFIVTLPFLFYIAIGLHQITIFAAIVCSLLIIFPSQRASIQWIFELKRRKKKSPAPHDMSRYAVIGREKELRKMTNKARLRFILGCFIPVFGLAFIYFPYAWANDAVRAECVASELVSPSL